MLEIAYVELYVQDRAAAVDYFVSTLGFVEAARCEQADLRSTHLRQGEVDLVVTTGAGAERFLSEHGDGVFDVAFTVADVPAALDRAVAAGATSLGPAAVSGTGISRHTLIERAARPARTGVDGRDWTPVADGSSAEPSGRIGKIDHFALCVASEALEAAADFYEKAFGLGRFHSEHVAVGSQGMDSIVVRDAGGAVTFTILAPDGEKEAGQLDGFLTMNGGAGVQHIAFLVDDIVASVRESSARGGRFQFTPDAYYDVLSDRVRMLQDKVEDLREARVLADRDEWGCLFQIFARSPYPRDTLFYELIQREGAQGFGTANIRALYESVERARTGAR